MSTLLNVALAALVVAMVLVVGLRAVADDKPTGVNKGDAAPTFEATDDAGKTWKSADHFGKKIVVVYFYPADMTPGCTKQACGFRDAMKAINDKDVEVVGVSGDSVKNHQVFKALHKLNFTLLADEKGEIAKKFGVPVNKGGTANVNDADGNPVELKTEVRAERWTFIIGKDGKVADKWKVTDAQGDSKKILETIEKLK
jgi:peroxiredoxin Q/BCP